MKYFFKEHEEKPVVILTIVNDTLIIKHGYVETDDSVISLQLETLGAIKVEDKPTKRKRSKKDAS